jgi:hypothetical protein
MLRQASRVGKAQHILGLVQMAEVLLDAGFGADEIVEGLTWPTQGNVTKQKRMNEAMSIARMWPEDALVVAQKADADWHALYEPAHAWQQGKCERGEVAEFAMNHVQRKGYWPSADDFRRRFKYREFGHKGPGEAEGQAQLGDVA